MPLVPNPQPDYAKQIADLQTQVAALSKQQNVIITNAAGQKMLVLGLQSDGTYGLRSYDTAGRLRVAVGQLPSGDYGLETVDPNGNVQEVIPMLQATVLANESTTSTSWTDLATVGPSVTAWIGASGSALLMASALMSPYTSTAGYIGIGIDGAAPSVYIASYDANLYGGFASATGFVKVTGLSPGSHTFKLMYYTTANNTQFANRAIAVFPL